MTVISILDGLCNPTDVTIPQTHHEFKNSSRAASVTFDDPTGVDALAFREGFTD
jgi:hypothetical protein